MAPPQPLPQSLRNTHRSQKSRIVLGVGGSIGAVLIASILVLSTSTAQISYIQTTSEHNHVLSRSPSTLRQNTQEPLKSNATIAVESSTPPSSPFQSTTSTTTDNDATGGTSPQHHNDSNNLFSSSFSLSSLPSSPLCNFRTYPKHRYYGLSDLDQPPFLSNASYIHGVKPVLLDTASSVQKICLDQSPWKRKSQERNEEDSDDSLPVTDGTNPTLLSKQRITKHIPSHPGANIHQIFQHLPQASYLGTVTMKPTNSLCSWRDTAEQRRQHRIANSTISAQWNSQVLLLDDTMTPLLQADLVLERDAPWGKSKPPMPLPQQNGNNNSSSSSSNSSTNSSSAWFRDSTWFLDDIRLLIHNQQLWISFKIYRPYTAFGSKYQQMNPLHLEYHKLDDGGENETKPQFTAYIKASETVPVCCGRNMALLEEQITQDEQQHSQPKHRPMSFLLTPDPITVVEARRPTGEGPNTPADGAPKHFGYDFHGTSGMAIHLPSTNEYLCVGHIHRGSDNQTIDRQYSLSGHHYTHSFFTFTAEPPYQLLRLSQEFIFPSPSTMMATSSATATTTTIDGEIIQFASGLDIVTREDGREWLVIAYGINDCESAAIHIPMVAVEKMLRRRQSQRRRRRARNGGATAEVHDYIHGATPQQRSQPGKPF